MREQRLVFGEDAELYDRARPSYPAALIDTVVSLVGERTRALDVGCGTGKATVLLAERGLSGVAVEPDRSMAAIAERRLARYARWTLQVSDFETWNPGLTETVFDLVCCAQAWHWLDARQRLPKAHDFLRSEGWLALWWNRPAEDESVIRSALDEVYQRLAPGLPARGIGSKGVPELDTIPPASDLLSRCSRRSSGPSSTPMTRGWPCCGRNPTTVCCLRISRALCSTPFGT
jgi:SAM-dependent methyltransferase